ncbi:TDT family transporter [Gemella haemolysans]|uniref:C4-dicarboxylate transporter/malic acid transport protein n=1 Tax=Gemella haemolysans ATCC 10379 TaxID=546270 RepID=C5NVE7_9BACL|nr:TDT family transporter [Gemella haemolysans]EER68836.1 C4-dicarboxylate transporter/malic acid transport protein [Gemella haemolysans ATCC 10379]KAA8707577.1 TDT family transporter [Gemella haemolysans]UBH81825.1 TDT family transporter [Gemella haemolysans]VEI38264.1 potassium-tellurite ethidium and proflavin transporter [Gemella haemolysans]
MNIIKNLPTPIAGLALGSAALGNLLQPYSSSLQLLFNLLSLIIIVLLTIKFVLGFDKLKKEMENPVVATVMATYPMSIMLLASFSKKYIGLLSMPVWIIGIFLDFCVVCYAIYNFIIKERHISKIYPTWFITFVGPAVVTVTAINYNLEMLGLIYFYFSYINYLLLLPFVLYRVYKYKHYKDGDYPTITVFSAPGGLLLASYMIGVTQKSNIILAILIPLTILLFIFVLFQLPYLLKRKFYPSFSAFTFPLVICAISFQKTGVYYQLAEFSILNILIHLSELLAIIIVIYVWYGFIKNLSYSN